MQRLRTPIDEIAHKPQAILFFSELESSEKLGQLVEASLYIADGELLTIYPPEYRAWAQQTGVRAGVLGVREVRYVPGREPLAVVDTALA